MEFKNQIVITGKAYNAKVHQTKNGKSITTFGLSVYNGKDLTGRATYCFIDCKYFSDEKIPTGDISIIGRLGFDTWEKEGKKFTKPVIIVSEIKASEEQQSKQVDEPIKEDSIPF